MKKLRKADQILVTTWSIVFLGSFLSTGSVASEVMCQESSLINQQNNYNSLIIKDPQPILLAQKGGRSRPSGVSGSRPEGVGGSRPEGVAGTRPEGVGGSRPEGVTGTRPEGVGGSRPEGAGGTRPEGLGGSRPNWGD